ncbi:MAG TPA: nucleotide exchange factor GrpE [Actinomycetota bacterium]|nr:nucleotide exchange factor GrpE [Actinomycetota bacterium]
MSEKQREETEKTGPRKVKVTDRRRVSADEESTEKRVAQAAAGEPSGRATSADLESTIGESRGSEASEASRRNEAPPANAEPQAREVAELREHLQRMAADFDNYRKRVLKEQTRAVEMAAEPLVRRLLEVLDEFDLALIAAEQKPDFEKFLHGVELVYAKLLETLRGEGVEKIEAEGKPFDPSLHEALMQLGDTDGDPFVADVLRPGYTLRGRVIRPAGVKVVRK